MKKILAALVALTTSVFGEPPAVYRLPETVTPFMERLSVNAPAPLGIIGDSIATNPEWPNALWTEFATDYGGSPGYRSLCSSFAWLPNIKIQFQNLEGVTKLNTSGNRNLTWGIYTASGGATQFTDLGCAILTVPAGYVYRLHYLRYPGGGTLVCDRTNVGGTDLTFSTDGPIGNATVDLPAGTKYKVSAGAGMVQVNGLEILPPAGTGGVIMYPVGRGNNNPAGYNLGNTASTASQWQGFGANLLLIQTDWYGPNQTKASFITALKAYINYIRLTCPDIQIILIAHHMMAVDNPDVSITLHQIAVEMQCGFIDHRQLITFVDANIAGYIQPDGVHLTPLGGQYFAAYDRAVIDFAYQCWIDLDENGIVDINDVIVYDGLWASHDPTADVNHDGFVDEIDLDEFNAAYTAGC